MTDTTLTDAATTALLVRARGLLERGWCVCMLALDHNGDPVDPASERAVHWCPYGALLAARQGYTPRSSTVVSGA